MKLMDDVGTRTADRGLSIGGVAADAQELAGRRISSALRACPDLRTPSPQRDALWLTVRSLICTTGTRFVVPFGSSRAVMVTEEHATDELLSAMEWLTEHEGEARTHVPLRLFVMLRGVATRSKGGSGRSAQADALHGMTEVPAGRPIRWNSLDESGAP